jgi:hypothetical protein
MSGVKGEGGIDMSARPRRRSGNLSALKLEVWGAIRAASVIMADPSTGPDVRLKAASTMATAGAVYLRILMGSETEDRIAEMEALMRTIVEQARHGHGAR